MRAGNRRRNVGFIRVNHAVAVDVNIGRRGTAPAATTGIAERDQRLHAHHACRLAGSIRSAGRRVVEQCDGSADGAMRRLRNEGEHRVIGSVCELQRARTSGFRECALRTS